MSRKGIVFDFVVKHKTDCYRAFKICAHHKGFNTKEGSLLIEYARKEIGYSRKTWDGDIYFALWKMYKAITIDGIDRPEDKKPWKGVIESKDTMKFGEAIKALKEGKKVAREGWNGKGMFIYLQKGSVVSQARNNILDEIIAEKGSVEICGDIDMKAADGKIVIGWLASQTDMLSEDWTILS